MSIFKRKTPGAAVDKVINALGKQVNDLDAGIKELFGETVDYEDQIKKLREEQKELDSKIDTAFNLRNVLAE